MSRAKRCTACKNCIEDLDGGKHNDNDEWILLSCLFNLNPKFPCDRVFEKDTAIQFARNCSKFSRGTPQVVPIDEGKFIIIDFSKK